VSSATAAKALRDDPAATAYVTSWGLMCRPGNKVVIAGELVEVQPDWWFPPTGDRGAVARAVRLCQRCPAQQRCLILAELVGEEFGVWGGRLFERPTNSDYRRKPGSPKPTALYDEQGRRVS
jgi:hypothetical protein